MKYMTGFVLGALLSILLVIPPFRSDPSWYDVSKQVNHSVVRIDLPSQDPKAEADWRSVCTGFSINEPKGYYLTAAHCLNVDDMTVAGKPIDNIVYVDESQDLLVVQSSLHLPALHPAHVVGAAEEVGMIGYGLGEMTPIVRFARVSAPDMYFPVNHKGGPWLLTDKPSEPGMSGGPVYDNDGRVVSIIQESDTPTGFGVNISAILDSTAQYWQYKP